VYFEGETTIYEGMPVCYNYDTTDNWLGVASVDFTTTASSVTESGTTAEGAQNEGKFIRVEIPSASNLGHFAGVVAGADHEGETGPKAIDIYIPNGAVVPVRCDVDTSTGVTILAMTSGEEELGFLAADSRPIAVAWEDEDGLGAAPGITLAKLDPGMFSFNYGTSSGAYAESPGTYPVNYQYVEFTSVAPTVCFIQDNRMLYDGVMASGQLTIENIYLHFTGTNSAVGATYLRPVMSCLHLDGCTLTSAAACYAAVHAQLGGTPTSFTNADQVCALWVEAAVGKSPGLGRYSAFYVNGGTTGDGSVDQIFYFKVQNCDYFAKFINMEGGAHTPIAAMTGDHTTGATDRALKVIVDATTYYIPLYDGLGV